MVTDLDGERTMQQSVIRSGAPSQTIAVYDIVDVIDSDQAKRFGLFCDQIRYDTDVKAVVLRMNTPGGGVSASDRMGRSVRDLKSNGKTVIVSMGSVAASGGYYVSAPADAIIAEPTTITGSIGVIAQWVVVAGTLNKIGAEAVVIRSGSARKWKGEISVFNTPDADQREHIQGLLDKMQKQFDAVVINGRAGKLRTETQTYMVAQGDTEVSHTSTAPLNGKVYLADEALSWGLIDEIGYLDDAIARAGLDAGLDNANVVHYTPRSSMLSQLMESKAGASLGVNIETIDKLQMPRLMMIWKVQ